MPDMIERGEPFGDMTVEGFTAALASGQPVPGGGSAAAVTASLAASLTSMVVRLSLERPAYAAHAPLHRVALVDSDAARARFLALADDDAAAYASYREARRLPSATAAETSARDAATRAAARAAAAVPLAAVDACRRQVELVERLAGRTNPHASSDLDCAALLLEAAARAAAANVLVNLPAVGDEAFADETRILVEEHLRHVQSATARTRDLVASGLPRDPEPA
jgi:formiminotetrahydrofolate cyclodeaminase